MSALTSDPEEPKTLTWNHQEPKTRNLWRYTIMKDLNNMELAMRVTEGQDKLGTKEYATYRSGVGTLLYLTKHSRPDLCKALKRIITNFG